MARLGFYHASCPAAVLDNQLVARASDNHTTFQEFLFQLNAQSEKKMGVLTEANRDVVAAGFPSDVVWTFYGSDDELGTAVQNGSEFGGIVTGALAEASGKQLELLPTDLLSYFGMMLRTKAVSSAHLVSFPHFCTAFLTLVLSQLF
eukprot:GHVN01018112.1.p1 GENE.GHVN01018112.1~~GHVN01018112.1.p1  ORF type:complete len:164 (-),score=23.54 GHVN01018112.1:99-539(-)